MWRSPEPLLPFVPASGHACPGTRSTTLKPSHMADPTASNRQLRLLTALVVAAERAACMTAHDIATAKSAMVRFVAKRQTASDAPVTDAVLLAFRLAALHTRLNAAEEYRRSRKMRRT
jgi:hypothetical protein